ncbi:hypothetical protein M441DRAFT_53167 [Trichoderma asperellum CBS 433.97]|uniref:C3H1-type domain-containing protein n=1 Tax=Trichoderma asperellum (strain ATCC 204424 / CBS 433.97 / NBRC 101777) TaxID=1042311 RepID=A0A2T3ZNM7_TRIA4|nr:hypothetical protein M441DRAFT_53167 [Trichoderma asperellum CBS 433.97]PTB46427.1 hypothetical protein M441DRAFT_53167 [Trichoderma asperellum CBS 433.97]
MAENQDQLRRLEEQRISVMAEDERKAALISDLFKHIGDLTGQLAEAHMDLRDRKDMLELKRTKLELAEKQIEDLRRKTDDHVFSMVIIDGDNMPFQDEFARDGLTGGKRAAGLLRKAITEDIKTRFPSLPANVPVMIRVYANLRGLSKKYRELMPDSASFEDFVRGFNTVHPMCDFIDAGCGKECADEKIKASIKFGLDDSHCKQVFFGGPGDNGYARVFDSFLEDQGIREQITLMAGPPFAYELAAIKDKFHNMTLDNIFRSQKLPSEANRRTSFHITPPGTPMSPTSPLNFAAVAKVPSSPAQSSPAQLYYTEPKMPSNGVILRNKFGQRVDSRLSYLQSDFSNLKDRKLCNNFHILGKCYYLEKFGKCHHIHGEKLVGQRLEALRAIARQSPCLNGLSCSQTDCVAGHKCPREPCHLENCWFPKEMHNVESQAVE